MRFLTVLCITLVCLAQAEPQTPKVAVGQDMSPENKAALFTNNQAALGKLDARIHKCVQGLLTDLSAHQTFIKLHTPIPNGHSIHFDVVQGNGQLVSELSSKHGVQLVGSNNLQLLDLGNHNIPQKAVVVEAAEAEHQAKDGSRVPAKDNNGALQPTPAPLPADSPLSMSTQQQKHEERARRFPQQPLDAARRKWYLDNNMAVASKLAPRARLMLEHLIKMMQEWGDSSVVQLTTAIPGGHSARFMMAHGDSRKLSEMAERCGIKIDGDSLVVPDHDDPHDVTEATWHSQNPHGHLEVDSPGTNEDGSPKKIEAVDASKRNIVKELPKKHLENEK